MLVLFLGGSLVIIQERKHIFYLNIKYDSSLFFSDNEVMLAFLFAYTYHTLGPPYLIKYQKVSVLAQKVIWSAHIMIGFGIHMLSCFCTWDFKTRILLYSSRFKGVKWWTSYFCDICSILINSRDPSCNSSPFFLLVVITILTSNNCIILFWIISLLKFLNRIGVHTLISSLQKFIGMHQRKLFDP